MNPTLKPPGTKHLKLKCDVLLSAFAFNLDLRRYNMVDDVSAADKQRRLQAWAYTRPLSSST